MTTPSPAIGAFWRAFSDAQASLQALPLRERVGAANALIDQHLEGLALEMSGDDADARQGLRLLLHGSTEHRGDDRSSLWVPRQGQHPAWTKLWGQLHGDAQWRLIPRELAGWVLPNRWPRAGIEEIGPESLIAEIQLTGRGIPTPTAEAHPATAQMMIMNPLSGRGIANLFSTHPATEERVARLRELARA